LPLEWEPVPGVNVHYLTAEAVEVRREGEALSVHTAQDEFVAEMTLAGWRCAEGEGVEQAGPEGRVKVHGREGWVHLRRKSGGLFG
ncbi:MAG: hypothetical protein ONB15_13425, partial [candidate division KSB1 bacterium]|nr:hypothetical protein [candidate division KSB1 bacterium]